MQYVKARESADEDAALWRLYVADSLFYSGQNKRLTLSYSDMMKRLDTKTRSATRKSADDIAADVIRRHGIKFERKEQSEQ